MEGGQEFLGGIVEADLGGWAELALGSVSVFVGEVVEVSLGGWTGLALGSVIVGLTFVNCETETVLKGWI